MPDCPLGKITSSTRHVQGTTGDDVIRLTGSGRHTVHARAGDDTVCGSPGVDIVHGGGGPRHGQAEWWA